MSRFLRHGCCANLFTPNIQPSIFRPFPVLCNSPQHHAITVKPITGRNLVFPQLLRSVRLLTSLSQRTASQRSYHSMRTALLPVWLSLLGLLPAAILAEDPPGGSKPAKPAKPVDPECTVTSPHSENFFDLRKLRRLSHATPPQTDWIVKGLDYGANFSINICGPGIADASGAQGVGEEARGSVAAFYEMNGTMYSIGFRRTLLPRASAGD